MTEAQMATYRTALKEARASFERATNRLREMASEKSLLDNEVARLRRTITALAAMCTESPWTDAFGITEACAEVMETELFEVSTHDVVRRLENLGFDIASQKNAAASVHAVLTRLAEKGKIEKITDEESKGVTWKGPHCGDFEISDDDIPF